MPQGVRVPASFAIGGVRVAPATVLAPMAGVTDTVFRRFIKNASKFTPESAGADADVDDHLKRAVRLRAHHDRVHLRRRPQPHARDQAQALPHLLRRRAPHLRAALRLEPRDPRRLGPHLPGRRLRRRRPEPRLPGQARRRMQRRLRPAARSAAHRSHLQAGARSRLDPLHGQVPHGLERPEHRLRRACQTGRGLRPQRRRPARAHPRKRLLRPGPLAIHRRMSRTPCASPSSATATSSPPRTPPP